jgi:TRAP-type mannitol/chloroaromatic compound transport system substrate-binding protein
MRRVVGLVVAAVLLAGAGPAAAQTFRWKLQSAVPAGNPHMDLLQRLAADLDAMSGGRLKIEVLPDGAVVRAFEILEAVNKGLLDAGQWWTHYAIGKHPAAGLFSSPLGGTGSGLDQMGHLAWYFRGGGRDLYLEFYQKVLGMDVAAFLYAPDGPEAFGWFKKPMKSVAEFRQLRFRISSGLPSDVLKELGGVPMSLSGGEVLSAAERGLVDGVEWINPVSDLKMGLADIYKFYSIQGLHQAIDIADIVVNGAKWRALPPDLQRMIEVATKASILEAIAYFAHENAKALKVLTTQKGVTMFDAPADYAPAYIAAARKVLAKFEAQNPFFKKVLESQRTFAKEVVPYTRETTKLSILISGAAE